MFSFKGTFKLCQTAYKQFIQSAAVVPKTVIIPGILSGSPQADTAAAKSAAHLNFLPQLQLFVSTPKE